MGSVLLSWLGRRLGLALVVLAAGAGITIATAIQASGFQWDSSSSVKTQGDPDTLATYIVTPTRPPTRTPVSTPFFDFRLMPTSPIFQYVVPGGRAVFRASLQHLANLQDTYGIWAEENAPAGWAVQFCIGDETNCYDAPDTQLIDLQPGTPDLPLYVKVTAPPGAPNGSVGSAMLRVRSFSSWEVKSLTFTAYVEAVRLRVYLPMILRDAPSNPTPTPTNTPTATATNTPTATATPYYAFTLGNFNPNYLSIDPPAEPTDLTFSTVLTHLGNRTDTYRIWAEDHTPAGWMMQFCIEATCWNPAETQQIALDPGAASVVLSLKITVPAGAPSGSEGVGKLWVQSVTSGGTQSQTGTVHIK